jgi:DNA processing protein
VVVEAAEKSGTLITARDALDQGREIMAVPGHPVDGRAGGCNQLIRDGATLVRNVEDVLRVLHRLQPQSPPPAEQKPPAPRATTPPEGLHQRILDLLGPSPVAEDQLIRDLSLSAALISPALVLLEMQGTVRRHPGGLVSRA